MANSDDARRLLIEKEKAKQLAVINEFKKIRDRLSLDIFDLMKRIEHARQTEGNAPPGLLIQKARLNKLLDQVSDEIRSSSTRLGIIAEQSQRSAISIAKRTSDAAELHSDLSFFDSAATRELIGIAGNGEPLDLVFRRLAPLVRERVFNALFYGLAAGRSNEAIAREIGQAIGTGAAGAMTTVRTETNRAYREATRKFYEQTDGVLGWRWLAVLDLRTCPICWALHGSIFPTSEKMATHPNCRCTMTPVFEGDEQKETGPERFAALNRTQQKAILGPERFKLYEQGAELKDFVELHPTPFGPGRRLHPLVNVEFDRKPRTPAPRPFPNAGNGTATPRTAPVDRTTPKAAPSTIAIKPGEPVPEFQSWDDAAAYMEQRFPNTKFDFGQMDVRAMNETAPEIARLFDEFPEVAKQMRYVGTYDDKAKLKGIGTNGKFTRGEFAHATHPSRGPGYIGLNPSWYKDADRFRRELERCKTTGWLASGKIKATFAHEFGHSIDGYLTRTIGRNSPVDAFSSDRGFSISEIKDAIIRKYKPNAGELSDYAYKNRLERFPEAFAQYQHETESRSRLADTLEKFLRWVRETETFNPDEQRPLYELPDAEQRKIKRQINDLYSEFGLTKPFKNSEL